METIHKEIERRLVKLKKGRLLFLSDFRDLGSGTAVKMAFSRLSKQGKVRRIAHGIYFMPQSDPIFGEIQPSMEEVAEAVARKEHIHIRPAGAFALNKLGLTTQMPMRLVFITDGSPKQIRIGKTTIKFKATTPRKLSYKGTISGLVIQAIDEIGTDGVDPEIRQKLIEQLKKEDPKILMGDMKLAPAKISDFLFSLLKEAK
jgi:predicted transcriptional regulator of viral defense system